MGSGILSSRGGLLQRISCRFGHHHRDSKNVSRVDKSWRSVCVGCGLSMIKIDGQWTIRPDTRDPAKSARRLDLM